MNLLQAIEFASKKHRDQRRKDATKAPYINHCIRVANIVQSIGAISDAEALMAAVLHDTIEDTDTSSDELEKLFGLHVRELVQEMSDDKSLSKEKRKQLQIDHAPHVSKAVSPLKFADKIANCEDLLISAPVSWSKKRIYDYFRWALQVVERLPRTNEALYTYATQVIQEGLEKYALDARVIVYGDIHGCLDEFKALREKLKPTAHDREIIIGDILDKGPFCVETLRYAQEKNIECIMGNHEYQYHRFHKHHLQESKSGKKNPMSFGETKMQIYERLEKHDFDYITAMPFFIKIDALTLLHAGITNDIDLENAKKRKLERVLYIRSIDSGGKQLSLSDATDEHQLWSEVYDGAQGFIVYGHNGFEEVRVDEYAIGIDTGCVYGNKLSAIVVNDTLKPKENYIIVDVSAKEEYATKRS